jgi:hypothetical protein
MVIGRGIEVGTEKHDAGNRRTDGEHQQYVTGKDGKQHGEKQKGHAADLKTPTSPV